MLLAEGPHIDAGEFGGGLATPACVVGQAKVQSCVLESRKQAGAGRGSWADNEPNLPQVICPDGEMASQQFL